MPAPAPARDGRPPEGGRTAGVGRPGGGHDPGVKDDLERTIAAAQRRRERRTADAAKARRQARALYSTAGGKPRLLPSFALYLDELGVKNGSAGLTDKDLRRSLEELDRLSWFLHSDTEQGWQRMLTFSDNVVVGMPLNDRMFEDDGGLHSLVFSAAWYQLNLALLGRFMRGGFAYGPLYMDDRTVVGQALVDAVALESTLAVHPRIVLDQDCTRLALEVMDQYGPAAFAESPTNAYLLVGADGLVFVNYLIGVLEAGESAETARSGLQRHRDAVAEQLASATHAPRVRQKYVWLADYHNFFCREFTPFDDMVVDTHLTDLEQRLPHSFRHLAERPRLARRSAVLMAGPG